jgi:hypothetical protein
MRLNSFIDMKALCASPSGDTPLHLASYGCHISCVRRLVEAGADVHIISQKYTAYNALDCTVRGVIRANQSLTFHRSSFDQSALHIASSPQHPESEDRCAEVVRILISAGVHPDIQDRKCVYDIGHDHFLVVLKLDFF